jgi:dihydrofolate reductase
MMKIAVIAAVSENEVIGSNGRIPWVLPEDLAFFKETTMGHPIIMGRKTYESIGRPLPGRQNMILTRQSNYSVDGADIVHCLDAAIDLCQAQKAEMLFVIGGSLLYQEALKFASDLYLTQIHLHIDGDTYFPKWDRHHWNLIKLQSNVAKSGVGYDFCHYQRTM